MTERFIDRVYKTPDQGELRGLYDDWAAAYDADLTALKFATPDRVAEALARHLDGDPAILDFACGTGLSGIALAARGFTRIDGFDTSAGMLDIARKRDVYRNLIQAAPDDPLPFSQGEYKAVTASAAISPGAAPGRRIDDIIGLLPVGGLFVLSLNGHAMADPDYRARVEDAVGDGRVELLEAKEGPHLPGVDLTATVFVLRTC